MRGSRSVSATVLAAAIVLQCAAPAPAQEAVVLRDLFALERVQAGLGFTSAFDFAPDGRIFLAELLTGKVQILDDGQINPTPFLTLTDLAAIGEQGLTGLVLDPDFANNRYVYIYYTKQGAAPADPEPTWRWIQDNVFDTLCVSCHSGPGPGRGGLKLEEAVSYAELVNKPSKDIPSLDGVEPGNPDTSYLVWKLEDRAGIVGSAMPLTGVVPQSSVAAIKQWIKDGAQPENVQALAASNLNRVVRYTEVNGLATDPTVIVDAIPAGFLSNGGAMAFASDGTLFIQTGDGMTPEVTTNLASLGGKILRVNSDGSVPANNPFVDEPTADPRVFSYGHRNGLGIAPDELPATSPPRLYVSENGTNGNDELNLAMAGLEYGWPDFEGPTGNPCCESPLHTWADTTAPTGLVQYQGSAYAPFYRGDLFVGHFRRRDLDPALLVTNWAAVIQRVRLDDAGTTVESVEDLLVARFPSDKVFPVALVESPDGILYFTVNSFSTGGELYRLASRDADADGCADATDLRPAFQSPDEDGDEWGADCDCDDSDPANHPGVDPGCAPDALTIFDDGFETGDFFVWSSAVF